MYLALLVTRVHCRDISDTKFSSRKPRLFLFLFFLSLSIRKAKAKALKAQVSLTLLASFVTPFTE